MTEPRKPKRAVAGWREWIELEELTATPIKAKLDTGARTSSLHAFDLRLEESNGVTVAEFGIYPVQRSSADGTRVRVQVRGFRNVRSSSGHRERRAVIRTPLTMGGRRFSIDLTLTSRDEMGFRMLLGRAAIRNRFLVDPGRSFCLGDQS